ncbi:MAG: DNA recombination protein RmuC [Candidatus Neomarinimicrobiota bacterium]
MELSFIIIFLAGFLLGALMIYVVMVQRDKRLELTKGEMKDAFASLSLDALSRNTDQFLKVAKEALKGQVEKGEINLEEKKKLIDANLEKMASVLEDLRKQSTSLSTRLSESQKGTDKLRTTTEDLRNLLSSSQARGQWGERMVEDILRLIGFVENVNYVKQKKVESGEIPDYTFFLPREKRLNMDVKFPLAHYEKFVSSDSDSQTEQEQKLFLKDVKGHIKQIASRGYINPHEGTVDYVLLFIPNESIYAFLHQHDPLLIEFALEKHIVLCSPLTLYAVLSLIHQAVGSFTLEEKAGQIMSLLKEFEKQWQKFVESMQKMGKGIEATRNEFERLTTTRTRQLEKPLQKIKEIELGKSEGSIGEGSDFLATPGDEAGPDK